MKVRRDIDTVHIELTSIEARFFLEELANVRGGNRLPKLRQICRELELALGNVYAPPRVVFLKKEKRP